MRCFWILAFVSVAVMCIGATNASAEMMANVAAGKPTTAVTEYGYYGDERMSPPFAVDEQLRSLTGYVSQKYEDDVWWEVDLGAKFNFDQITVYGRRLTNAHLHLNGAYLCAYDDMHAEIATQVLSGYSYGTGDPNVWILDWDNGGNGWTGAQYLAVEDRDGVLNGYNDALNLNEVVARTDIPTHPRYITDVTCSGNMIYSDGAHADVQYELIVNGSGMKDQTGLAGELVFGHPNAIAREIHGGQWTSGPVTTELPELIFDLGGSHAMAEMLIWNLCKPGFESHSLKEVTISTSQDGVTYTPLADTNGDDDGTHTIPISPGGDAGYQLDVDLTGITANYVKLLALSSHGLDDWGLSEVRFYQIPEPSGLVFLAVGGLLVLCRRRRY